MPEKITGVVIGGQRIGRRIGFPTANLFVQENSSLMNGVYAVKVEIGNIYYGGIANFGKKPTVGYRGGHLLEVHIFDFEGDLYGQEITVEPISYIRGEKKFESLEELRRQIEKDKILSQKILK